MPTDPYVPANVDDTPRHLQNLPPGVALPPPDAWVPDRPGEIGPDEPEGRLFGRPGPNIGYALTLVQRQHGAWKIGEHEHLEDADAVVSEIAMKRAASFGRAPVKADVDVAVALLGYDGSGDARWVERRTRLVHGADHGYATRRGVVDAVPDTVVRASIAEATARAAEWRASV